MNKKDEYFITFAFIINNFVTVQHSYGLFTAVWLMRAPKTDKNNHGALAIATGAEYTI